MRVLPYAPGEFRGTIAFSDRQICVSCAQGIADAARKQFEAMAAGFNIHTNTVRISYPHGPHPILHPSSPYEIPSPTLRLLQNQEADDGAARINRAAAVFYAVFLIGPWLLS